MINCAGPFTKYGEPVLSAAVETTTHYLDTTGEQGYMRMAFERYGPEAESAGVAVIPAMGFDYVPGDMIAALTAEGMGEVDEVSLAYAVDGLRGDPRHDALDAGDHEGRGRRVAQAAVAARPSSTSGRGSFDFPEPIGRQRMVRYPAGEQITVPRHIATRRVRTLISASTIAPRPGRRLLPLLMPADRAWR